MDLDELIRTELTAQAERAPDADAVLAGVPARARARRQRRLLGGAAAAAILAAAVPAVALRPGPDSPPAAGGVIERCLADAAERPATLRGGRVLVTFGDRDGRLVWIGGDGFDMYCPVGRDGLPTGFTYLDRKPAGVPAARGYLAAGPAVELAMGSNSAPDHDGPWPSAAADAAGRVSREVRRVVLRWTGAPPVRAALDGPYFLGRVTVTGPYARLDSLPEVSAYDGTGRLLGRVAGQR